jgi:hypothetical protein
MRRDPARLSAMLPQRSPVRTARGLASTAPCPWRLSHLHAPRLRLRFIQRDGARSTRVLPPCHAPDTASRAAFDAVGCACEPAHAHERRVPENPHRHRVPTTVHRNAIRGVGSFVAPGLGRRIRPGCQRAVWESAAFVSPLQLHRVQRTITDSVVRHRPARQPGSASRIGRRDAHPS